MLCTMGDMEIYLIKENLIKTTTECTTQMAFEYKVEKVREWCLFSMTC